MVNLAGVSSALSPGLLVGLTIENNGAVPSTAAKPTPSGAFPTSLAGITVTFNGVPAPLFALNGQQLNGAVPFAVVGQSTVQMCIASPALPASCTAVPAQPVTPAVLAVTNEDGSVNSPANPAPVGSIVTFYAIGFGVFARLLPDGTIVAAPLPALAAPVNVAFFTNMIVCITRLATLDVSIAAQVTYAGPAPDEVAGVYQINAVVPNGVNGTVVIGVGPPNASVGVNTTVSIATGP